MRCWSSGCKTAFLVDLVEALFLVLCLRARLGDGSGAAAVSALGTVVGDLRVLTLSARDRD